MVELPNVRKSIEATCSFNPFAVARYTIVGFPLVLGLGFVVVLPSLLLGDDGREVVVAAGFCFSV